MMANKIKLHLNTLICCVWLAFIPSSYNVANSSGHLAAAA